jgi:quercetin dioxygenase-like cupin family protein
MDAWTLIPNLSDAVKIPEKGIVNQTLYNDDHLRIIVFGFAAGHELAAHTAPAAVTLVFLRGEASVTLGGATQEATEGTLIHMQPKLTHGIVAKSPLLMLLYMHKGVRDQE